MAQKIEYRIKLVSIEFLNGDTCYLGFDCPEIAGSAIPGQFVNISAGTVFLKDLSASPASTRKKDSFMSASK